MYDLKTASRLYVLEPHTHAVSSVNFSPDGRRVLTVSLDDGDVTVWKVGSSLSGFFNVGGPPRQGGHAGEPFKRIGFFRGDDGMFPTCYISGLCFDMFGVGPLKETSALSDIKVEWPGERKAKVMIKETALTFET
jgi:WD40 repeat protein